MYEITPSLEARFWNKVDRASDEGCWTWMAGTYPSGYGMIYLPPDTTTGAHRISYEIHKGPIPEGLEIDHLCSVRTCVNPMHLEAVTHRENMHRTPNSVFALEAAKTHCSNGHEFTPENTYVRPSRPNARNCRSCKRVFDAGARARKREARRAV